MTRRARAGQPCFQFRTADTFPVLTEGTIPRLIVAPPEFNASKIGLLKIIFAVDTGLMLGHLPDGPWRENVRNFRFSTFVMNDLKERSK